MEPPRQRPVAVVTGGTGGIGSRICIALAREGMHVVVGYNQSADAARAVAGRLAGQGHTAMASPVTDSLALASMAEEIGARYGCCDVLVNCAGITRFVAHGDLEGLDDALIDRI